MVYGAIEWTCLWGGHWGLCHTVFRVALDKLANPDIRRVLLCHAVLH